MNARWQNSTTILNKLRVKHSQLDTGAAKLRMLTAFTSVDLTPPSLSPSAIVIIRKLGDPLPKTLKLRASDMSLPGAWQQAMTDSIEQLTKRAYRPLLGAVPADAEAVMFLDKSELLACLARDWCASSLAGHWWWHSLFKIIDAKQLIFDEWLQAPQFVPMALVRLAQMQTVKEFILNFTDDETLRVLHSIIQSFALLDIQSLLEPSLWTKEIFQDDAIAGPRKVASPNEARRSAKLKAFANSRVEIQADFSNFSVAQSLLCLIGLMIGRAPAAVRSPAFANALKVCLQTAADDSEPSPDLNATQATSNPQQQIRPALIKEALPTAIADLLVDPLTVLPILQSAMDEDEPNGLALQPDASHSVVEQSQDRRLLPRDELSFIGNSLSQNHRNQTAVTDRDDFPVPAGEFLSADETIVQPSSDSETRQTNATVASESLFANSFLEADLETSLGGVFYLINLGLFLNLYGDFTTPMQPGIRLSIWDFLTLVGQAFCGKEGNDDSVWSLLAKLAERNPNDPPGSDFLPPAEWRVPVDWLAPFANNAVWRTSNHRLQVVHSEGFSILDVPTSGTAPGAQLAQEVRVYDALGGLNLQPASIVEEARAGSPLDRWLTWLMAYLRARLARALAIESKHRLAKVLLQHQARVRVTAARLDVYFDLNQLPIEVRLSGLDRNPGWVPAAGRFIEFHFV